MIEFQLTIYMCSHCTRVHNAPQECLRHEIDEHSPKNIVHQPPTTSTADPITTSTTDKSPSSPMDHPFVIATTVNDVDVKPNPEFVNYENEVKNQEESSSELTPSYEKEEHSAMGEVVTGTIEEDTFEASTSNVVKLKTDIKRQHLRKSPENGLNKTAKQSSNRQRQTTRKKHVCNVCKVYSSNSPGDLRKHLLVHSGENPHKCQHCSKRFNQSSTKLRHERVVHKTAKN